MTPDDFAFLAKMLKDRSGLILSTDKGYLVESRLMPVARHRGLASLAELVGKLRASDASLIEEVTEAMTTNESFFFRDTQPFEQFKKLILPHLLQERASARRIRIWSAACSSGQEPYSLSMILKEEDAKLAGWNIEIIATDISKEILAKAKAGLYSQFEVQRGLPIQLLMKYFTQEGDKWRINPVLAKNIRYNYFNLLDDFKSLGQFDVIFCRNVLIYFDQETKGKILNRMAAIMAPDGKLYLGGAETVIGISDKFEPIPGERGLYRLKGAPAAKTATS